MSGVVAVTAALANYYKLGKRSHIYRITSEGLTAEVDEYMYHTGPYQGLDEKQAFDRFFEQTRRVLGEHPTRCATRWLSA